MNAVERKMVHIPEDKFNNIKRVLKEAKDVIDFDAEVGWASIDRLREAYEIMEEA